jgi:hypothetical protein
MNRFFLTLLALLTGLAVPNTGVNARACTACGMEIGAPAALRGSSQNAVQNAAPRVNAPAPNTRRIRIPVPLRASLAIVTPTVRMGVDRSLT